MMMMILVLMMMLLVPNTRRLFFFLDLLMFGFGLEAGTQALFFGIALGFLLETISHALFV